VYSGPITVSTTKSVKAIAAASGSSTSAPGSASYTINLPAATPTFSPGGGTYSAAQTVAISTTTPSATIYYTTDGSTPTTGSAVYSAPITVSVTKTVKAIAATDGSSTNLVGSASYTISPQTTSAPTFSPAGGTYSSAQMVTISTATPSATIYYTTDGSTPTTNSRVYSAPITVSATKTVKAIAASTGSSTSAPVSASYTINLPAATPTFSPGGGTYGVAQTVTISTATPSATIYYTTNGSAPTTSSSVYTGPITVTTSETVEAIAVASAYSISGTGSGSYSINLPVAPNLPPAATPTFFVAGGTYGSAQAVTISSATLSTIKHMAGTRASMTSPATIYYTTDGSMPTTSSQVYTRPISVSATETVKAIAVAIGYSTSAVGSASYTIKLRAPGTPTVSVILSPASLTLAEGQSGTTTIFVIPQNGFASNVSLSCSGLPTGATCNFSPATLTPSSSMASTLTIATSPMIAGSRPDSSPLFPGSALAASLCCFDRRRRRGSQMLMLAGVAFGVCLCTGCGAAVMSQQATVSVIASDGALNSTTSLHLTLQ
jgi:Chitobiase/beta-hexosaminidase C-terminal domain